MSMGYGGFARLIASDEQSVMYEYGSFDWNDERYRNDDRVADGIILIRKSCFPTPEIHEKIKKTPSGRKKLIRKTIPVNVDAYALIKQGMISVEISSFSNRFYGHLDRAAVRLIYKIFFEFQMTGEIPQSMSYLC